MEPLSIIFAGSGEFGVPTLRALLGARHRVVAVYSQPDRPAGRGRKLTPTPLAQVGLDLGLNVIRTQDLNSEVLPPADLLVVIAFGQKISRAHAAHPRLGSINLHASRLPAYRGAAPINWAIIDGQRETGNTVIRLAQRMDAGAILGMSRLEIGELETAGELHDRLAIDGAGLMLQVISELALGRAKEIPQDDSRATRALKLSRESSAIDWQQSGEAVARKIRGMYPWPGCRVRVIDAKDELDRVTLVRARPAGGTGEPGQVLADGTIACGQGAVEMVEIQPESKRPMNLPAYRNGHRWEPPLRLESIL